MSKSHYETLGVKPDASPEEIKRAYRKRAEKAHPDKRSGSHEEMAEVAHAKDVLLNPTRRSKNGQDPDKKLTKRRTKVETEIAQAKPAQMVKTDNKLDKMMPAQRMVSARIHGGIVLHEDIQVRVSEMANWPAERITEFFEALANVVEIPQRPLTQRKIKRAWSKDFESDDEEGTSGLSMLYLVSMMHDGMEDREKEAVWTLIKYLKRIQAHNEAVKETN